MDVEFAWVLAQLTWRREPYHLLPIIVEIINRFADVAIGLAPGLAGFENFPGREGETLLAHFLCCAEEKRRTIHGRRRSPVCQRLCCDGETAFGGGYVCACNVTNNLLRMRWIC